MIVATGVSEGLGRRIAKVVGERYVSPVRKVFPDGEFYTRLPVEDEEIIVVGSTHQPDRNWVELLLLVDAAVKVADRVKVVVPYYGYSRQDRVFLPGEPVSAGIFAKALKSLGVEEVVTVDVHFHREEGRFKRWGMSFLNVSAARVLGEYLRGVDVIVAPDEGARGFADRVARVSGSDLVVFEKERDRETGKIRVEGAEVEGEVVAIVDDIIASGGTMARAAEYVRARRVIFAAVHGVFSPGWERLKKVGEVVVTDTIEREESRVSVAETVGEAL